MKKQIPKHIKLYEDFKSENYLEDLVDEVISSSEILDDNIETLKEAEGELEKDFYKIIDSGWDINIHPQKYEGVAEDEYDDEEPYMESVKSEAFDILLGGIYDNIFGEFTDPYYSYSNDKNLVLSMCEYYYEHNTLFKSYESVIGELFNQIIEPSKEKIIQSIKNNNTLENTEKQSYIDNIDYQISYWFEQYLYY